MAKMKEISEERKEMKEKRKIINKYGEIININKYRNSKRQHRNGMKKK